LKHPPITSAIASFISALGRSAGEYLRYCRWV